MYTLSDRYHWPSLSMLFVLLCYSLGSSNFKEFCGCDISRSEIHDFNILHNFFPFPRVYCFLFYCYVISVILYLLLPFPPISSLVFVVFVWHPFPLSTLPCELAPTPWALYPRIFLRYSWVIGSSLLYFLFFSTCCHCFSFSYIAFPLAVPLAARSLDLTLRSSWVHCWWLHYRFIYPFVLIKINSDVIIFLCSRCFIPLC